MAGRLGNSLEVGQLSSVSGGGTGGVTASQLAAESNRALAAEQANADAITAEVSRAGLAEADNANDIAKRNSYLAASGWVSTSPVSIEKATGFQFQTSGGTYLRWNATTGDADTFIIPAGVINFNHIGGDGSDQGSGQDIPTNLYDPNSDGVLVDAAPQATDTNDGVAHLIFLDPSTGQFFHQYGSTRYASTAAGSYQWTYSEIPHSSMADNIFLAVILTDEDAVSFASAANARINPVFGTASSGGSPPEPQDRVHAGSTTVAAVDTDNPTLAEISTWNSLAANSNIDTIIYYTGDDSPTSVITHVYHADNSGVITLLQEPTELPPAETQYGAEQVDVISSTTHDWSWTDSRNFLMTTAQENVTINYPTDVLQGHEVSVLFQSTRAGGTTFTFQSTIIDTDGNALPPLYLPENGVRRIIFGTTNALFVAALDYPNIVQGLASTIINSSLAVVNELLPSSTGVGVVRLYVNGSIAEDATLRVPTGQTLNGEVDGTFPFSDHPSGTQFRADEVVGGWVVSVVGASGQETLQKTRIYATTTQAIDAAATAITGTGTLITASGGTPQISFDAVGINIGNGADVANNAINITQDGPHDLSAGIVMSDGTASSLINVQIIKNGTELIAERVSRAQGTANLPRTAVVDIEDVQLSENDVITVLAQRSGNNGVRSTYANTETDVFLHVSQKANTASAMSGSLDVEDLHSASVSRLQTANGLANLQDITNASSDFSVTSGTAGQIEFLETDILENAGSIANAATNNYTIVQDGKYRIAVDLSAEQDGSVRAGVQIVKNSTEVLANSTTSASTVNYLAQISCEVTVNLVAGDVIDFRAISSSSTIDLSAVTMTVQQVATQSVVNSNDVTNSVVNGISIRQSSDGYIEMWGTDTQGIAGNRVITFPNSIELQPGYDAQCSIVNATAERFAQIGSRASTVLTLNPHNTAADIAWNVKGYIA